MSDPKTVIFSEKNRRGEIVGWFDTAEQARQELKRLKTEQGKKNYSLGAMNLRDIEEEQVRSQDLREKKANLALTTKRLEVCRLIQLFLYRPTSREDATYFKAVTSIQELTLEQLDDLQKKIWKKVGG